MRFGEPAASLILEVALKQPCQHRSSFKPHGSQSKCAANIEKPTKNRKQKQSKTSTLQLHPIPACNCCTLLSLSPFLATLARRCAAVATFTGLSLSCSRILRMVSASLADAAARMERWMANCSVEIHRASWDTRGGRGARCITTAASWRLCDRAKWVKLEKIQSRWKCVFAFVCSQDQVRQHV